MEIYIAETNPTNLPPAAANNGKIPGHNLQKMTL